MRTSEHHGTLLKKANSFLDRWITLVLDLQTLTSPQDILVFTCLDAFDDFQASVYIMLTGFYRQSFSALRTALEEILIGVYFKAYPNSEKETKWKEGQIQLWISDIRKKLSKKEPYSLFEQGEFTLLNKEGWIDSLYSSLSAFSHGRPSFNKEGNKLPTSNVGLWGGSNGPVYEPKAVKLWSVFFFDTALLSLMLVGLAEEKILMESTHIDFFSFLEFLLFDCHPCPNPIAKRICKYLVDYIEHKIRKT